MIKKLSMLAAALLFSFLPLSTAKVSAATNLITNPSVISNANGWTATDWSTNTRSMTYVATGHGDNGALRAEITAKGTGTDPGADGWYFSPVAVTAGQSYEFSFWYQSNVSTQVDATFNVGGTESYLTVGTVPASAAWAQYKTTFTAPTGATNVTLASYLTQVGYITTDEYSLTGYAPTPLNRPMVSVTFDDGWANQYINGKQVLKDNGINATFYMISKELNNGQGTALEYMSKAQAQALFADGHEMASHTIDHCSMSGVTKDAACTDPTAVSPAAATQFITNEMSQSKTDIQAAVPGSTVSNFAYPYGEYSTESMTIGKNYYTSQRTVECGYNSKDNLDLAKLKGCEVNASTSVADIKALIDNAITQKTWLVLFYHEIADPGQGVVGDEAYTVSKADFTAVMQYINQRKADIDNKTMTQAIAAINGTVTPPADNRTTVYRMANWMTKERLFTTDLNEVNFIKDKNGWVYEGVSFQAATSGTPVYRMANWMTKERLFTTDLNEVNFIKDKNGWVYENIAFYAANSGTPVYRMANWMTKERLFTTDLNEVNFIKDRNGWVYENIAFYAQ